MDEFNRRYAEMLGVWVATRTFDGGQDVTLTHQPTGAQWNLTIYHGDEARMNRTITKRLHTLPWPQEDDPRVEHTGEYA